MPSLTRWLPSLLFCFIHVYARLLVPLLPPLWCALPWPRHLVKVINMQWDSCSSIAEQRESSTIVVVECANRNNLNRSNFIAYCSSARIEVTLLLVAPQPECESSISGFNQRGSFSKSYPPPPVHCFALFCVIEFVIIVLLLEQTDAFQLIIIVIHVYYMCVKFYQLLF